MDLIKEIEVKAPNKIDNQKMINEHLKQKKLNKQITKLKLLYLLNSLKI